MFPRIIIISMIKKKNFTIYIFYQNGRGLYTKIFYLQIVLLNFNYNIIYLN